MGFKLTDEEAAGFYRDGFVILRKVLPATILDVL
jgi:hypothetical protein